jgi:membrane protein required for colicin V production
MNLADIIVFVALALSAAIAFARGFVREVLSIGAWVGAAAATIYGFPYAQPFARRYIEMTLFADLAAGVAIFVVVLVLLTVVSHLLAKTVRGSALGAVDRSLGLLFGLLRGAVLVCVAYMVVLWAVPEADRPAWLVEARTAPIIQKGADFLLSLLPESALKRGGAAADQARDAVNQAIGTGETLQDLSGQGATPPAAPPGGEAAPDSTGSQGRSGYNDAERKNLDQLFQGTQ